MRNIPWSHNHWLGYLLACERGGMAATDIDKIWNQAYIAYRKPEHGIKLWTEYVFMIKRRCDANKIGDGTCVCVCLSF
jgi:hypothetical protein